jgi:hypothetical protein
MLHFVNNALQLAVCPFPGYSPGVYLLGGIGFATIIAGWGFFAKDPEDRKKSRNLWLIIFVGAFFVGLIADRLIQVNCFPG